MGKTVMAKNVDLEDDTLIESIREGDHDSMDYILKKYRSLVRLKAGKYFFKGGDREDIIQEGMIGLYKAIRDYRKQKAISFRSFAELCITRQIITAVKTATRQKHIPLNSSISLDKPIYEDEPNLTLLEVIPETIALDPIGIIIKKEESNQFSFVIRNKLTYLERRVLALYLAGQSYAEISDVLGIPRKSIDNALQRIKKKLEKIRMLGKEYITS